MVIKKCKHLKYKIKDDNYKVDTERHAFSKRKKLTKNDCQKIKDEAIIQGEQAWNDLCLSKGYKIGTFYKFLLNEGKITPKMEWQIN